MNHLQGLSIKVVGQWPTLPKKFNRKENTMQYMTNKMLQRFMSHMTTTLSLIQLARQEIEEDIRNGKCEGNNLLLYHYKERKIFREDYLKYSSLQEHIKRGFVGHSGLQRMEKVVTMWISNQQDICSWTYEDYLENRYDPFYRNKSKQAKKKLEKLVELQQAIRKQKSITKD